MKKPSRTTGGFSNIRLSLGGREAKSDYLLLRRRMKAIPPRHRREVRAGSGTGGTSLAEIPRVY
jgi:hypothetical protein